MNIDYNSMGITNEMISNINAHASLALGECVLILIIQEMEINKDNLLKTLICEIEKKHDDTHRGYRLAIEMLAIHCRKMNKIKATSRK
ncbi:hypothetical protein [Klebsiella variicola]|uniref:hypothetical protein n=1 Tax=Klebsiella variicola TaxID=244366 RepID=UPI0004A00810|nr:hypothetical protein [Klebsiella variicola]KDL60590.1 hypothetical protein AD94_01766 [Klebsiella variicola]